MHTTFSPHTPSIVPLLTWLVNTTPPTVLIPPNMYTSHNSNSLCLLEQEEDRGERHSDSSDIGTMEMDELSDFEGSASNLSHAIMSENDTPNHQSKFNTGNPSGLKKGIFKSVA